MNSILCLVGDFNLDTFSPSRPIVCDYLNTFAKFGIQPTISASTREEYLGDKFVTSCLDHLNIRAPISEVTAAVIKQKLGDHYFISCHLFFPESNRTHLTAQKLVILDIVKFAVADFDWQGFLQRVTFQDGYQEFLEILIDCRL